MDDKSSSMLTGTADTLEDTKPSYWLDACEDISCDDLIPGEFPPVGLSNLQDTSLDPCFFDGILDSIPTNANIVDAQLTLPSAIKVEEDTVASLLDASGVSNGLSDGNNGNSFKKSSRPHPHKHRGCDDEQERFGKRARIDGGRHLHLHLKERERERPSCRKRARDYEEKDRRDNSSNRSSIRRKEQQYGSNGRRGNREMDWREGRGYWERDRLGTNDMVFRPGSWESGCNRDIKPPVDKNLQGELKKDNDDDNSKKKVPKEHARKYQLDVLEQAKNKNTIAFLETGAGKTLIAVLLIKSVCNDLHRQGKKMLAVFLVPKVPLVYQQAEVIRDQTGYQVGHYCGEMGQDFWDARRWHVNLRTSIIPHCIYFLFSIFLTTCDIYYYSSRSICIC